MKKISIILPLIVALHVPMVMASSNNNAIENFKNGMKKAKNQKLFVNHNGQNKLGFSLEQCAPCVSKPNALMPYVNAIRDLAICYGINVCAAIGHEFGHAITAKLLFDSPICITLGTLDGKYILKTGIFSVTSTFFPLLPAFADVSMPKNGLEPALVCLAGPIAGIVTGLIAAKIASKFLGSENKGIKYGKIVSAGQLINLLPTLDESDGAKIVKALS